MDENRAWTRRQILMAISWLGGFLGLDRFYQGQIGWGLLKLVTVGGFLIWWLADAFVYTVEAGRTK